MHVYFHIHCAERTDGQFGTHVEGNVPVRFLDPFERTRPEIARTLLLELRSENRQNVDTSDAGYIRAEVARDTLPNYEICRENGRWKTKRWIPVPRYEPSVLPDDASPPERCSTVSSDALDFNCRGQKAHFFLLEEGSGRFKPGLGEEDCGFVFEGEEGRQTKLEAPLQGQNADTGRARRGSSRYVASFLLDRLSGALEAPGALSRFKKVAAIPTGQNAECPRAHPDDLFSLHVFQRHRDGWMTRGLVPVEPAEGAEKL